MINIIYFDGQIVPDLAIGSLFGQDSIILWTLS